MTETGVIVAILETAVLLAVVVVLLWIGSRL